MKYNILLIPVLIILSSIYRGKEPTVISSSNQIKSKKFSYLCELETIHWMGTDSVTFVKLSIISIDSVSSAKNQLITKFEMDSLIGFHSTFASHVPPFSVYGVQDSCITHGVHSYNTTGYFLIDDFINIKDSVRLFVNGYESYYGQGGAYLLTTECTASISQINNEIDSLVDMNPYLVYATREWYSIWKKKHPKMEDQRIKHSSSHQRYCH